VDADPVLLKEAFKKYLEFNSSRNYPGFYGDGKTAEFILQEILMMFEKS